MCTDNGIMIAWTAVERIALGCRYAGCQNLHMSIYVLRIYIENSHTLYTWTAVECIALGCRHVECQNLYMSVHVLYIRVYGKL